MTKFYKFTKLFCHWIFKLLYKHKVSGLDNIPNGSAILAPNHLSFLDPPLIGISLPDEVSFLARESLFKKPLLGWLLKKLNVYPVKRGASDLSSFKIILRLLGEGKKVIIFPEGVRSHDGQLISSKPGICMLALKAKVPIIPAYIHGTYEIWPRQSKFPKLSGKTVCIFGKPIYPDDYLILEKKIGQERMSQKINEEITHLRELFEKNLIAF